MRRAGALVGDTLFIPHHQREVCNEGDPDSVPCNLHMAGSGQSSSIPYLISDVV